MRMRKGREGEILGDFDHMWTLRTSSVSACPYRTIVRYEWTLNASSVSACDQSLPGSPPPLPFECALKKEEGESLGTKLVSTYVGFIPFMSESIKLSIKLTHSDGLGIQNVSVHLLKRYTSRSAFALESRERITQHFVAFGLAGDRRPDQHETVTYNCGLVELDAFIDESYRK